MAQGAIKKSKSATSSASSKRTTTALGPKPGPRVIAPKKAKLVKQRKMAKKLSSGLIHKTERSLAERAGHLELLANSKKDKQKEKQKHQQELKKKGGAA